MISFANPVPTLSFLLQKILTMVPTEEEKQKIQEAQLANPGVPLGTAEQFLLTLSSINGIKARLQLWAFKLDYEVMEKVNIYDTLLRNAEAFKINGISV